MIIFLVSLFLIWRSYLFFIAWFGAQILPYQPSFPYSDVLLIPSRLPDWIWSFANFDGVHYLTIANQGYEAQYTQVFFPLYPLLIKVITIVFPFFHPIVSGLLISTIFFLLSLVILEKLLSLDYKREIVYWVVLFLIFFPTSFFFGSLYTESFFLFLILASFYTARKKKWWLAGILGGLAGATRLVGIFLLPALLWEHYQNIKNTNKKIKKNKFFHFPPLYLVPLGLLSYMLYLQLRFGDWLYFWHVQPVFGAQRSGGAIILLPQVIWRYFKMILTVSTDSEIYWIILLELLTTLTAIILLLAAHCKNIRISYLIFSWLAIITPALTGTFSSMPRYVLVIFPMFIVLGMIKSKLYKTIILIINFLLLSALTVLFTRGHWVS